MRNLIGEVLHHGDDTSETYIIIDQKQDHLINTKGFELRFTVLPSPEMLTIKNDFTDPKFGNFYTKRVDTVECSKTCRLTNSDEAWYWVLQKMTLHFTGINKSHIYNDQTLRKVLVDRDGTVRNNKNSKFITKIDIKP